MRSYRLMFAPAAATAARGLHPDVKQAVRNALTALATDPEPGLPLSGELVGLHRYKVRRFRIVYEVDTSGRLVRVMAVGHR